MPREKPLTVYPGTNLRRAMERIGTSDHDRPLSKVAELAVKAFIVLWDRDKYEALRLADEFETKSNPR